MIGKTYIEGGMAGLHFDMGGFYHDSVASFSGYDGPHSGMGEVHNRFRAQMSDMGSNGIDPIATSTYTNNYNDPPGLRRFQLPNSFTESSLPSLLPSSNFSPRPNLSLEKVRFERTWVIAVRAKGEGQGCMINRT